MSEGDSNHWSEGYFEDTLGKIREGARWRIQDYVRGPMEKQGAGILCLQLTERLSPSVHTY